MNVKPLQLYGGGLVTMEDCPPASSDQINAINHAAVVVGWGEDEESGKPYFLIKNSYGQDWGENGYARLEMAYDGDSIYGACADVCGAKLSTHRWSRLHRGFREEVE